MKSNHLLLSALAAIPLALAGCSDTSGISYGEEAGGGGAGMANAASANGATVRTGSISTELIEATVVIIGKHEATARQKAVAVERGKAWSARHVTKAEPKHHRRYIAVDTQIDSHTAPQAERSVMIFDTEAEKVVGKNVYDVQTPPPVGSMARFETYSAQYVGPGQ